MKSLKTYTLVLLAATIFTVSCTGDLDPQNVGNKAVTAATVYKTPADYLSGLAKLYASFALSGQQGPAGNSDIAGLDEGFGVYLRELWNVQELTTDEAVISWNDQTVKNFHWQSWTANDVFIAAMYSRIMLSVTYCNEFIRASATSTDPLVKQYNAEARFLRALAYWHALDMFGNPPFVTEKDLPGAFNPKQTNPANLFAYLDSELQALVSLLPAPGTPGGADYGHATKGAVYMLQAKLYLNAQTYIGTAKYTECITALKNLFQLSTYSLAGNYLLNFAANNMTSPELIFTINYDGAHSQSYGGMDYIIHAAVGGSMNPGSFGIAGGWGGTRVTSAFVGKFADPSGATDTRAQFYTSGQSLQIVDIGQFTNGYAIKKFSNRTIPDGPSASGVPDFVDTDFPMFRLADAKLMLAEAFVRGGSGTDATTATQHLNDVIRRAYNGSTSYDHSTLSAGSSSDLSDLLDERARELYWEGHRRTDLIRYGQFSNGSYMWPWKGNVPGGAAVPSFRNLFPIPSTDLSANPTLKQNTGY
ncbi:MAG: RagB/SusD family nutrient uptake outer membrane protein [Cytophagales bacterium]|jgi:hypothetical protein|nr:RagB/SusD family nutrient uptake outer membrane protein [Bacteroidota bacterium]MBS1982058.1 RagB/SusD family nutrient uptake outer membrane protein [Bacteroidota bacterium]WHZ06471.1 MAG: RagB/SusD family nutrient uptake outer membrane protein [Cytophagales bacterium]